MCVQINSYIEYNYTVDTINTINFAGKRDER